jgi:hypothetical protein
MQNADSITDHRFVLPFTLEIIRAGKYWFSSHHPSPVTRNQCRIDVVAAWNLFRWIPFGLIALIREIRGQIAHHGTQSGLETSTSC